MKKGELADMAVAGARLVVRVTPQAGRNAITREGDLLRIAVSAAPEDGKANAAVTKLLARALGCAKSDLTLVSGARGRDKVFTLRG